jgi:hypothetical protein
MNNNPASHKVTGNLRFPVEQVTWFDAILYCNARSKRDNLDTVYSYSTVSLTGSSAKNMTGQTFTAADLKKSGYRLLTNAEEEYCVRSHTHGMWWWTNTTDATQASTDAAQYVWWSGNDSGSTRIVATKKPDSLGLYDMTGNLFEWCNDWEAPYDTFTQTDPIGAAACNAVACTTFDDIGLQKMARGGSFKDDCNYHGRTPYHFKWTIGDISVEVGFRCAATVVTTSIGNSEPVSSRQEGAWFSVIQERSSAKIDYALANNSPVIISIFDCQGTLIRRLVSANQPAGRYSATWDGKTTAGKTVGAGAYIVSVTAAQRSLSEPIFLTN